MCSNTSEHNLAPRRLSDLPSRSQLILDALRVVCGELVECMDLLVTPQERGAEVPESGNGLRGSYLQSIPQ